MSLLIVVCPHCLTWAEPQADRCTECGAAVDVDAPDPDAASLALRLGESLLELGPVRLDRHGWPSLGHLVATSEGLLFLPKFVSRSNGAIMPRSEEPDPVASWTSRLSRAWWWSQSSQRTLPKSDPAVAAGVVVSPPLFQRLFDAPGGLFVARASVRRVHARWNHLQIERRLARSVTLRPVPHGANSGEMLRQLRELAVWRDV